MDEIYFTASNTFPIAFRFINFSLPNDFLFTLMETIHTKPKKKVISVGKYAIINIANEVIEFNLLASTLNIM